MAGRLSKLLVFAAVGVAVVALVVTLVTLRSSRDVGRDLEAVKGSLARQTDAAEAQSKAMATLSQRVTDAAAQATAAAEAAAGVGDLAARVSQLETDSEAYARAIEFLDSKYPQAKLDEDVVGKVVESGRFSILQAGALVGEETYDLFRTDGGYALVAAAERVDGRWGASLKQTLRLDETLRLVSDRIQGMDGSRTRNERADVAGDEVHVTTASGRVVAEKLSPGATIAALGLDLVSPLLVLHRAAGMPEGDPAATAREGRAVLTWEGRVGSFELRPAEPITIIAAGTREMGYRHDVRIDGELACRVLVQDGTVIGVDAPGQGLFAYRSDLFPGSFLVESRVFMDLALPEGVREEELSFANAGRTFAGVLSAPVSMADKVPMLLIFPDLTAPYDRDGNAPGDVTRIGRELARGLSTQGIATFRYDRRGVGATGGEGESVDLASLVSDARVALSLLRAIPFVDTTRIYVAGIGRGATVAAALASSGSVSGLITLSAPSASFAAQRRADLERAAEFESLPALDVALFVERELAFQEVVRASTGTWSDVSYDRLRASLPWLTELEYASWSDAMPLPLLRDLLDLDPLETFRTIDKKVLVIQGDKDPHVQTSAGHALVQAVNETGEQTAVLAIVSDMNHALRPHLGSAGDADQHLEKNVDLRVLDLIFDWGGTLQQPGGSGGLPSAM